MDSVSDSAMRLKPHGSGTWTFCAWTPTALIAKPAIETFTVP